MTTRDQSSRVDSDRCIYLCIQSLLFIYIYGVGGGKWQIKLWLPSISIWYTGRSAPGPSFDTSFCSMRSYRSPCIDLASQAPNLCNFFFETSSNKIGPSGPANIILIKKIIMRERELDRNGNYLATRLHKPYTKHVKF